MASPSQELQSVTSAFPSNLTHLSLPILWAAYSPTQPPTLPYELRQPQASATFPREPTPHHSPCRLPWSDAETIESLQFEAVSGSGIVHRHCCLPHLMAVSVFPPACCFWYVLRRRRRGSACEASITSASPSHTCNSHYVNIPRS